LFIEGDGDIVFYKNKDGVAVREVQQSALKEIQANGRNPEEQDGLEVSGTNTS
jgi:omega-6 fatty acid desaturase (delta-12 desaturase)